MKRGAYSVDDRVNSRVKELLAQGWSVKRGGAHAKLIDPNGRRSVTIPATPSCPRAGLNFIHEIKRYILNNLKANP